MQQPPRLLTWTMVRDAGCQTMTFDKVLTDVPVGGMALGTMYFGSVVPAGQAHQILDLAYEGGVWFWDTANNYAFWTPGGTGDESEACLGDWFASRGQRRRENVVLATKIGPDPGPAAATCRRYLGSRRWRSASS